MRLCNSQMWLPNFGQHGDRPSMQHAGCFQASGCINRPHLSQSERNLEGQAPACRKISALVRGDEVVAGAFTRGGVENAFA